MTTDIDSKVISEEHEHHHHEGCSHHHHHDHEHDHGSDSEGDGEGGVALEGDDKVLNRSEKKARKLFSKSGMKYVEGIERVTIKRGRMVFAIANPTVYKISADSYVVFGEAKVEDPGLQAQALAAQRLAAAGQRMNTEAGNNEDNGKEAAEGAADNGEETEEVDSTGLDEKDISIVMEQAGVSRAKAVKTLRANNNDIVNTIMELTM